MERGGEFQSWYTECIERVKIRGRRWLKENKGGVQITAEGG